MSEKTGNISFPKHWKLMRLDEISEFITKGTTPTTLGFKWQESGIPFLRSECVTSNGFVSNGLCYICEEAHRAMSRSSVRGGDILISITGNVGEVCQYPDNIDDGNINQHISRVRIKSDLPVVPEFICAALKTSIYRKTFASIVTGQAYPQLSLRQIRGTTVPVPPLSEQKQIIRYISSSDYQDFLVSTLVTKLKQRKQFLMQQLLTGKKRFPEFAGTKWKEYRIGAFAEQVTQKNQAGKELPVLSCTKYDGLVDSLQYFGRRVFSNNISTYKIVNRNEFAYATNHIEEGSIGLQQRYDSALISPMYTVFRINNPSLATNGFLHLVLKTETYRKIFEAMTNASVNRRGSLRWKEFSRIRINLPTIAEQNRIVEFGKLLDHELVILTTQLELLQALKRGLMEKLLTGKLPIPLSEEAANV